VTALIEKLIGGVTMLFSMIIIGCFWVVWHLIPALLMLAFLGALIAVVIWLLTFKMIEFQILWGVCSVVVLLGIYGKK